MAASLVQGTGVQSSGSVTSIAKAYGSNVVSGNTLVAVGVCSSTGSTFTSGMMIDSIGNTWTLRVSTLASQQQTGIWTTISESSGANTVTFDCGTDFMTLAIGEIGGETNPVTLDGTGTGTGATTAVTTAGQTTASTGCVIGCMTHDGGSNQTIVENGGASTIYQNTNTSNMPIDASFKATTAGSNNPSWTLGAVPTTRWDASSAGLTNAAISPKISSNSKYKDRTYIRPAPFKAGLAR